MNNGKYKFFCTKRVNNIFVFCNCGMPFNDVLWGAINLNWFFFFNHWLAGECPLAVVVYGNSTKSMYIFSVVHRWWIYIWTHAFLCTKRVMFIIFNGDYGLS